MVGKSTGAPPEALKASRRERRREQSREEILDAAERVLLRDGLANVTLEAVAQEVELTKAALYYYFTSKDALLFEVVFRHMAAEAQAVHDAVEAADDGAAALEAIIRTTVSIYGRRIDLFRLVYLHGQMSSGAIVKDEAMLARVRPLNDLLYGAAEAKLRHDHRQGTIRREVHPRRLAFLAHTAALGLLTMKGLVEGASDPLAHRDADLIDELSRVFVNATRAPEKGAE
jgi:AcrR family transcriptional regulator